MYWCESFLFVHPQEVCSHQCNAIHANHYDNWYDCIWHFSNNRGCQGNDSAQCIAKTIRACKVLCWEEVLMDHKQRYENHWNTTFEKKEDHWITYFRDLRAFDYSHNNQESNWDDVSENHNFSVVEFAWEEWYQKESNCRETTDHWICVNTTW